MKPRLFPQHAERFRSMVDQAKRIVISTHLYPDADGIGSEIALALALREYGKDVRCINEDDLPTRYHHLDPTHIIESIDTYRRNGTGPIDLFIIVDTNAPERIGLRMQQLLAESPRRLYIDHHPCPDPVANLHCIDTGAAASGEIVGLLIESLGIGLSDQMALPLYTAILIDTNSFRYPSVTSRTHELVARLMATGLNPAATYNSIYGTKKIAHLRLLGSILASAKTNSTDEIAWIVVDDSVVHDHGAAPEDSYAFVNNLLVLDNVKIACMFRSMGNAVKVSLRSTGCIDVGPIAQALGGGGHNHSAATVITGSMENVIRDTIAKIETILHHKPLSN